MTSTDYIGIGVLITTAVSGLVQIINAVKLKSIGAAVDGTATAQATLIAELHDKITDKNLQISGARETAAVLASGAGPTKDSVSNVNLSAKHDRRIGDIKKG